MKIDPHARVCDLGLGLERSRFAHLVAHLGRDLAAAGIALRPHFYLSTEYGCISGSATIGLLWTDGFAAVRRLAARRGMRTRSDHAILSTLYHEVGHAFCYVHRLYRTRRFRELFGVRGSFFASYPDPWRPSAADVRRFERGEVLEVYAARHADEDFAVSFEHWLGSHRAWRRRYAGRPRVLEKLGYVDEVVARLGRGVARAPRVELDVPLDEVGATVSEWIDGVVAQGSWTLVARHDDDRHGVAKVNSLARRPVPSTSRRAARRAGRGAGRR